MDKYAQDSSGGVPAQLHENYIPPSARKQASSAIYHGEAAVDIVLIHGLGSKFQTTWAYERKDGSRYHWVREKFHLDMPDARILVFEYPSRWYDDPVRTDLTECASELLRSVIRDRCHVGSPAMCRTRRTRPIIFVGHSFGGLVIKQAMTMASQVQGSNSDRTQYENHRHFLSAIAGVIFLGTPHRGSSFALLAGLKIGFGNRVLKVKSNEGIIYVIKPDSYTLDELQRQFAQLCQDERMSELSLVCYYEMRDVSRLGGTVVSRDSAILDNSAARGMDANHMNMNTFYEGDEGRRDNNYDHFISDIRMISHKSQSLIPKRFDYWVYDSPTPNLERESLQKKLDPSREAQETTYFGKLEIYQAEPYTCQWIHRLPAFESWRAGISGHNAIWINGPAGSGKSVLAAYIIGSLTTGSFRRRSLRAQHGLISCNNPIATNTCAANDNTTPVSFFFCGVDRKSETPERMLATLIHQLLQARAESQELFDVARTLYQKLVNGGASTSDFAETLREMASLVGRLYIVIDNLEDIPRPENFIQRLSIMKNCKNVRFLICSQDTKEISGAISEHFDVGSPILITDHTAGDIRRFTETKGEALFQRKPLLKVKEDIIMKQLQSRAHGMFQWVNSALEHLKDVEDPQDVELQLDDIRGDLLDTYDKTFERLAHGRDDRIEKRIVVCLKFIAVSATPVTSADVKTAWLIQELLDKENATEQELQSLFDHKECKERMDFAQRDIHSYLSSIVDICSDGTLQFKHPSYLRALTRTETVNTRPGAAKFKFSLEAAHQTLSQICMTACRATTFIHANSFTEWRVPIVQYAWNFWAYHFQKSKLNFSTVEDGAQTRHMMEANPNIKGDWEKHAAFQTTFNKMIDGISNDALLYLEALMDFISRPLRAVPGSFSDREYVLSLQRAQQSLLQPSKYLCALRKSLFEPVSSKLQHSRRKIRAVSGIPVPETAFDRHQGEDKISRAKSKILGEKSAVERLRIDNHLKANPWLHRPSDSSQLLLEIARTLRVVALRLAVDPIYSALLATASGSSFSPLHPLVYLAQLLEDSGLYPYWDALHPAKDLMEPFICSEEDPEYASAKFVLHCFEWRDPRLSEATISPSSAVGFYMRATRIAIDVRPSPSNHGLTRVSTENREQVRRLHQVKAEQFYAANSVYNLFHSDKDYINKFIINPLSNFHMKFSLLVHEHEGGWLMYEDPNDVLKLYAPPEVREAPLKSFLRSLPHLMRMYFVRYVTFILEVSGQIARRTMSAHFAKIEFAVMELTQVREFLWRAYDPGELPPLKRIYFIPGLLLFWLRCQYFPSWGAYFWYHTWSQFSYAYNHPAVYVDLQNEFGFWSVCWNILRYFIVALVGNMAMMCTVSSETANNLLGHMAFTYSIFHSFCTIDRSLFAICTTAATLVACARIMLVDKDSVANTFKLSMFFWFMVFINIVITTVQLGALEKGGGWVAVIGGAAAQVAFMILCCVYVTNIMDFLYGIAKPARMLAMWMFRNVLRASVFTAQMLGVALLLFMACKALWYMHKFIWDPYDIEDSLKDLLQASQAVRKTLSKRGEGQYKRIGWYPLGEKIVRNDENFIAEARVEMGPPRAVLPVEAHLQELHSAVTDSVGMAAEGAIKYFDSDDFQSHRKDIGEFVDAVVLKAGDQVGRAIDGVGDQVGVIVNEVDIGRAWSDGMRQVKLQVRDVVDGRLKEE
ncbi:hypothetical protein EDB80DRAFT_708842 [Ilyonectria destructans]|nr:hypothetical protein EDB80DRAFT_708842 [Ilyonectria destructans]